MHRELSKLCSTLCIYINLLIKDQIRWLPASAAPQDGLAGTRNLLADNCSWPDPTSSLLATCSCPRRDYALRMGCSMLL